MLKDLITASSRSALYFNHCFIMLVLYSYDFIMISKGLWVLILLQLYPRVLYIQNKILHFVYIANKKVLSILYI